MIFKVETKMIINKNKNNLPPKMWMLIKKKKNKTKIKKKRKKYKLRLSKIQKLQNRNNFNLILTIANSIPYYKRIII